MSSQVFSGARAVLKVNGKLISGSNNIGTIMRPTEPIVSQLRFYVRTTRPYFYIGEGPAMILERVLDYGNGMQTYSYAAFLVDENATQEMNEISETNARLFGPHERLIDLTCIDLQETLFG